MEPHGGRTRVLSGLAFFALLRVVLHQTRGNYVLYLLAMLLFGLGAWLPLSRARSSPLGQTEVGRWLAVVAAFSSWLMAANPLLVHWDLDAEVELTLLRLLVTVAAMATTALAYVVLEEPATPASRAGPTLALSAIVLLVLAGVLVIVVSPYPRIDTWTSCMLGADYLLDGANPYLQAYPDIYNGQYDTIPGCNYWPGIYFWIAPARAIFGDIRYAFLLADVAFSVLLWAIARHLRLFGEIPKLFALAWLAFPVGLFELENAWNDIILLALFAGALLFVLRGRPILAGFCLGLAVSVKLLALPFALPLMVQLWSRNTWRSVLKFGAAAGAVVAVCFLPFVLYDPGAFFDITVAAKLVGSRPRVDALSVGALIMREFGTTPGNLYFLAAGLLVVAFFLWDLWRHRTTADMCRSLAAYFGMSYALSKIAFCNYWYLVAGLVLLHALCEAGEDGMPVT